MNLLSSGSLFNTGAPNKTEMGRRGHMDETELARQMKSGNLEAFEARKFDTPKPHKAHSVLFFCQFFKYCIA